MFLALALPTVADAREWPAVLNGIPAGIAAIEVTVAAGSDIVAPQHASDAASTARLLRDRGVSVAGLRLATDAGPPALPADAAGRLAFFRSALSAASILGARSLVAPVFAGPDMGLGEARRAALDELLMLRFDAEKTGVRMALPVGRNGGPTSPGEARDYLDDVNSYWVGADLDLAACSGPPAWEWVETLTHRIAVARASITAALSLDDLARVRDAMARSRIDGPLIIQEAKDAYRFQSILRNGFGALGRSDRPTIGETRP